MPFTGKATYAAGADLPELAEDVSDVIGIISPYETPLLDHLGDAERPATSTIHEWIEDSLLPNTDQINQATFSPSPTTATSVTVDNGARFQVGDLVRPGNGPEVMQVTAITTNTLTVVRSYGGTTAVALADNMKVTILGNAALEGADAPTPRFTARVRKQNYTQIFSASVEVSGTMQAARAHGVKDEEDFQKQERLRELLRDLENIVINGSAPAGTPQGSATVRRSMNGVIKQIVTNQFVPGQGGFPSGGGAGLDLNDTVLNAGLRAVWEQSQGRIDTIVVNGLQKRRINQFVSSIRRFEPQETRFADLISVYESDFGVARVILSRWAPPDTVLLLDSSRVSVMPLTGRAFHYRPMGVLGDRVSGLLVGEYTTEFKNEAAHAVIRGLTTS